MKTLQKDLTTGNPGKIIFNFANLENLRNLSGRGPSILLAQDRSVT